MPLIVIAFIVIPFLFSNFSPREAEEEQFCDIPYDLDEHETALSE